MKDWIPRWYYVMQNQTSGLIYVGQSVRINMDKYRGSGQYWIPHCRKHGGYNRDNIEVIEQSWFDSENDAQLWLKMLEDDVPNYWLSDLYANQVSENTLSSPRPTLESTLKGQKTQKENKLGFYNPETQRKAVELCRKNGIGFFNPAMSKIGVDAQRLNKQGRFNSDLQSKWGSLGAAKANELHKIRGTGWFNSAHQSEMGKRGGKKGVEFQRANKLGWFNPAHQSEMGKRASKFRFRCDVCAHISTAGGLGQHQKKANHAGKTRVEP